MFISYIIQPLYGETYLVRCIESLYEQTGNDFEVIVAEYHFNICSEYIKEALETKANFKIISECQPKDKLFAAAKLVNKDSQFVQLVNASSVATPSAFQAIRDAAEYADLLIPSTIIRTTEGFIRRFPNGWENAQQMDILNAFDYCFRKSLFDNYAEEILGNPMQVEMLMDILLSRDTPFAFVEETCYYITKSEYSMIPEEKPDYDKLHIITANFINTTINANKVKLFTKYIHRLIYVIDSGRCDITEQVQALDALKEFGQQVKDNYIMSRIFALNTGVSIDDMQSLDLGGYRTLRREVFLLSDTENSVGTISAILERFERHRLDSVNEVKTDIQQIKTTYSEYAEKMEKIQEDITAMAANLHLLMQQTENSGFNVALSTRGSTSSFNNPVNEVPYLYATGKLGLKTIIKSFNGWLRFKFRRKK